MLLGWTQFQSVPVRHCWLAHGIVLMYKDSFKLVYSGDTMECPELIALGQDCTLLIHEATFEVTRREAFWESEFTGRCRMDGRRWRPRRNTRLHNKRWRPPKRTDLFELWSILTAPFLSMNAARTVLTHFSTRYSYEWPAFDAAEHRDVFVAFDMLKIPIVLFQFWSLSAYLYCLDVLASENASQVTFESSYHTHTGHAVAVDTKGNGRRVDNPEIEAILFQWLKTNSVFLC